MAKEIGGIDDLPGDSVPAEARGGVGDATYLEMEQLVTQFSDSVKKVESDIANADAAKDALLNWANLLEKITNMVVPLIEKYASQPDTVPPELRGSLRPVIDTITGSSWYQDTVPSSIQSLVNVAKLFVRS